MSHEHPVTRRAFIAAGATAAAAAAAAAAGLAGCAGAVGASSGAPTALPRPSLAESLGHPARTPLLIVHADDVGIAASANAATIGAFERGLIDSASAMVPCPAFGAFADWARRRGGVDMGVHLTFTSQPSQRWAPLAGARRVPSLVDDDGMLPVQWTKERTVRADEVETEIRAQIAVARDRGLDLTHLDGHQHLAQLRSAEVFAVLLRVARDERLPFRFARAWTARAPYATSEALTATVPLEQLIAISPGNASDAAWTEWYASRVRALPSGLSELFVHLGIADDELRAVVPDSAHWGAAWRERDLAAVSSPTFAAAVRDAGAVRIGWREVRDYLN